MKRAIDATLSGQIAQSDAKSFVYLTAVVDWVSRKVLASKIAITLEACHAVDVIQEDFYRYGTPDNVNTVQGSQFTAIEFVTAVKDRGRKPDKS